MEAAKRITIDLAGPIAEMRFVGGPLDWSDVGAEFDLAHAELTARHVVPRGDLDEAREFVRDLIPEAQEFVRDTWESIVCVAEALCQHETLSAEQIRRYA